MFSSKIENCIGTSGSSTFINGSMYLMMVFQTSKSSEAKTIELQAFALEYLPETLIEPIY
jgi:hypothetical protein